MTDGPFKHLRGHGYIVYTGSGERYAFSSGQVFSGWREVPQGPWVCVDWGVWSHNIWPDDFRPATREEAGFREEK